MSMFQVNTAAMQFQGIQYVYSHTTADSTKTFVTCYSVYSTYVLALCSKVTDSNCGNNHIVFV